MKKIILFIICSFFFSVGYSQSSISYLEKAATNGDIDAQKYLAKAYLEGTTGTSKNLELSFKWYLRAAEQGDAESQYELGTNDKFVDLVARDGKTQDYWEAKAAFNGHHSFDYGQKLIANKDSRAFDLFSRMANQEFGLLWIYQGKTALGDCYHDGIGVEINYDKAFELWNEVFFAGKSMSEDKSDNPFLAIAGRIHVREAGTRLGNLILVETSEIEDAIKYYLDVYNTDPSKDNPVLYNLGIACIFSEQYKEASDWFETATSSTSDILSGKGFLGLASLNACYLNEIQEAKSETLDYIEKAKNKLRADTEAIIDILSAEGYLYYRLGDIKQASSIWDQVQQTNRESSVDYIIKNSRSRLHTSLAHFSSKIKQFIDGSVDVDIASSNTANTNTFVVIVANEEYKRVEAVPYAHNDGRVFKEYCLKTLGIPESNIQFIQDATYNDIKYSVNWLSSVINAYSGEAKIIFYYAGHGIPDEKQSTAYLLPIDGYSNDVTTGYKMDDLYSTLGKMPSKGVIVFLDACFSGSKREGDMMASSRGVSIKVKNHTAAGNMVILSAAQGDETAYPYKEQNHGMFTYYLLRKLQLSHGNISLGELSDYVISEVKKNSIVKNGKLQTPTVVASSLIGESWKNWTLK